MGERQHSGASERTVIMWFRSDLRTADHLALGAAAQAAQQQGGKLLCLYVQNPADDRGPLQAAALSNALFELNQNLSGRLLVVAGDGPQMITRLAEKSRASEVYVSEDYTPAGGGELSDAAQSLTKVGAALLRCGDNYAVSPGSILTGAGTHYRVFTPFKKRWLAHPWQRPVRSRPEIALLAEPHRIALALGLKPSEILHPEAAPAQSPATVRVGEESARESWEQFLADRLLDYAEARDLLAEEGTSRLSGQLAHGTIHPRTLLADLADADEAPTGRDVYATELAWREFYADFLAAQPQSGWQDVNPIFPHYPWDEDPELFAAWREGRTGFPVVDAAMRQLAQTGWMHNRARMIVASFLTKDLHQPWQLGAEYFLSQLVDADFASNQHGWQWTAGTGTDASPYFRIFNPYTQSRKFDPSARYIHRWLPELRSLFPQDLFGDEGVPGSAGRQLKRIHYGLAEGGFQPSELPEGVYYPEPIVDHSEARAESLRRYRAR
ncbi:cryptochrome/photolyase family protein [Boudabousia marimammalium]|uniref:Photolyase/cryptochrome alpha/beta domain-containing protein n=1 Tax=Boudabousia marimammalium TaxID=156892 RepID=A0A1Q5PSR1_9ACTO|nr:deoxyribodipyrimidine photo-lyase [Boudabousia marimammalium]OKL50596.1 hypothetical protein BM477_01140 [Boudabousia marimammalium]